MIDRPHPAAEDADRAGTTGSAAGFVNPWADCWGAKEAKRQSVQMQVEARAMQHPRMESTAGADPCEDEAQADAADPAPQEGVLVRVLPVINNKGLHARASAKFVQTVERYDAEVSVTRCGETVGGLSIMGLMMLAAARGTTITVACKGPQAETCMDALTALLADKFGEEA
jgi:phosphocarrier protein HPr